MFGSFVRRVLRGALRSPMALGAYLGILFLAKDVAEVPDAIRAWWEIWEVIPLDRESLLIAFGGIMVAIFVWRDLRPYIRQWWPSLFGPPLSIEFDPTNKLSQFWRPARYKDGRVIENVIQYRVLLRNNTRATIYGVRGKAIEEETGEAGSLRFADGDEITEIPPGGSEFASIVLVDLARETQKGTLTVLASGRDTREVSKRFEVDSGQVPAVREVAVNPHSA